MYKFITLRRACAALVTLAFSNIASAGLVIDINEVGSNVVATYSGSFASLPGANAYGSRRGQNRLNPFYGGFEFSADPATLVSATKYNFDSAFQPFGTRTVYTTNADIYSGTTMFNSDGQGIFLADTYTAGDSISGSATWSSKSFTTLGLTTGSYVYTLANLETVTLNIGPVAPAGVPEPGQVAASLLLLAGIGGYVFVKRRQAAKTAAPVAA